MVSTLAVSLLAVVCTELCVAQTTCVYTDCQGAGGKTTGKRLMLRPTGSSYQFAAWCDFDSAGGWTVIQRRQDGSENFNRQWADYKAGFGNIAGGEYWLGLDKIHMLTKTNNKLSVYLEAWNGEVRYANYSYFHVADETNKYKLAVSGYTGTAGDAMAFHNGMSFSTPDKDNDSWGSNCAAAEKAGWWFKHCIRANPNGPYYTSAMFTSGVVGELTGTQITAVQWFSDPGQWKDDLYSFKKVVIRLGR